MKISILNANRTILTTVVNGANSIVICKDEADLKNRIGSFIKFLNRYNIIYKIEENKITIKNAYVIFKIKD
jgi:hypothetical protein